MADITELDQMAQELRVRWRKANNYYSSFAAMLFKTKDELDTGAYGPEWTFERWLLRKAGLFENQVMQQLKVFRRIIAAEEREKIERVNIRIAVAKRAAKVQQAAQRRADAAERRAIAQHKKREMAAAKAEREARKQADQVARVERQKQIETEKKHAAKRTSNAERMARRRAALKAALGQGMPEDAELASLLAECAKVEATSRVELGRLYAAMKRRIEEKRAGKDEDGKHWTWGKWAQRYIRRSKRDVDRCIAEFGTSCPNSESENVVEFPKSVA